MSFAAPRAWWDTNRNWFVVVNKRRSRTVHERVYALVTFNGPTDTNLTTGTPTTFTGSVSPRHAGQRILLQRQNAVGPADRWHTIDRARIQADGSYTIVHRFRVPGDANLRALFPGDRRNLPSPSDALSYQISQRQNPQLTIAASANPIDAGQSVTISGQLRGATSPQPVTLHARTARSGFAPVATTMTDAAGNYSFAQTPIANTFYKVTATPKHSAVLFEGVRQVVSAQVDQTNVVAGTTLTFSGSVSPDKTGHPIYLQRQNPSGQGWPTSGARSCSRARRLPSRTA